MIIQNDNVNNDDNNVNNNDNNGNNKNDYSSNQDFMKICPHTNSSRRKPQKNLSPGGDPEHLQMFQIVPWGYQ